MLKVLIVDDDAIVRTSLKTLIDWERNGYEICDEASNGADAIQKLQKGNFNIVITDMSMPIIDGVGLIEFIGQNCPEVKVIALSGYDDFSYVRQSLKKGAIDYILKHNLDANVMINVLETAKNDITAELKDAEQKQRQQQELNQSRKEFANKFINRLVKGQLIEPDEIAKTIQELHINIGLRNLIVIVGEIDGFFMFAHENMEVLTQSFINISEEVLKDFETALISYLGEGKFVIIASLGKAYSYMYVHNQLIEIIERIKSSIKRYIGITISVGISNVCDDICKIKSYYEEAEDILKSKFFAGKDRILWKSDVKISREVLLSLDAKDEKKLKDSVKMQDDKTVKNCINDIFDKIRNSNASYKSVQMIFVELIGLAGHMAKEFGITGEYIDSNAGIPYEDLKKIETVEEMKQYILGAYERLLSLMIPVGKYKDYSINTNRAIEFINKNYQRDISLEDAAQYVGISSHYLSRIFKEESGRGFVAYLNRLRVEKAKILIETGDYKLRDIVEKVGFNNYNYFFRVFKEIEGITPTEYEKEYIK